MPLDSFIHKSTEFLLYPPGHKCEPSERVQFGVRVRSAKRPVQTCAVNALAKQMPCAVAARRRVAGSAGDTGMFILMVRLVLELTP